MEAYLQVKDLSKDFALSGGVYPALRGVDLAVGRGEFVSIIGHSGCGKSTLINLIAGLYPATSGSIELDGHPVSGPGPDRGMVFQHHGLLPWLSVWDNIYQAVDAVFPERDRGEKRGKTEQMLQLVGLGEHREKRPAQISGGMKQRTAIARAFAVEPRVLLLDEPFSALDALTKPTLHDALIHLWSSAGASETVVMVTHDIDEAIFLSDRVVVMTNGPMATVGEIVPVPLARPRDKRRMLHDPECVAVKDRLLYLLMNAGAVFPARYG